MQWIKVEDEKPAAGKVVVVTDGVRAGIGEWIEAQIVRRGLPYLDPATWSWRLIPEDTMTMPGWKVWWPDLASLESDVEEEPEPTHWAVVELPA